MVFDGVSDAVNYQLKRVLTADRYWRFQVELTLASDHLDDATEGNLAKLRGHAEELIAAALRRTSTRRDRERSSSRRGRCRPRPRTRPSALRTIESGTA